MGAEREDELQELRGDMLDYIDQSFGPADLAERIQGRLDRLIPCAIQARIDAELANPTSPRERASRE